MQSSDAGRLIELMNARLATSDAAPAGTKRPSLPVFFLVGLPRSGTTLLAQILVARFRFGYVNNLIAKFWMAPQYGIAITRSLFADPGAIAHYSSRFGSTSGIEGHHEFGYFWKRWFKYEESHKIERSRWRAIDFGELNCNLAAMEDAWQRPLIFKNPPALSMQVELFSENLDNPRFIYIDRDEIDVAMSIYNARKTLFGSDTEWFSTQPPDYSALRYLSPLAQIAGQIISTRREIERQLDAVAADRTIRISYEDLIDNTEACMGGLESWILSGSPMISVRGEFSLSLKPRSADDASQDSIREQFVRLFRDAA